MGHRFGSVAYDGERTALVIVNKVSPSFFFFLVVLFYFLLFFLVTTNSSSHDTI